MSEYIITQEQISELNRAHGGMKIVTSWLSCYAIWDTSCSPPLMKSEHLAITLPNVVRCRDCKQVHHRPNWQPDKRFKPQDLWLCEAEWCMGFEGDHLCVEPDGFCAWGVRKDD